MKPPSSRASLHLAAFALVLAGALLGAAPGARAQSDAGSEPDAPAASDDDGNPRFRLRGEIKVHYRDSDFVEVLDEFPFPPPFLPPGEDSVFLRTPEAGGSFELSTVTLVGELDLGANFDGRVEVHIIDLYNRNPTSLEEDVRLREAWLRFGREVEGLRPLPEGTAGHVLIGKAPRFSRQRVRRLESYGLWSTAVGRFEEIQLEAGASHGGNFYWRAAVASGNPLFFRDPNALAGDNGTPDRVPNNVVPIYQSGFPILYDSEANDVDFDGELQLGFGAGWRQVDEDGDGFDVLGWYFRRDLAPTVEIEGSFYSGDIKLLQGPFFLFPLPIRGDEKREYGVNLEGRWGDFVLYAQLVDQEIAGLPRSGVEIEAAWRHEIAGVLVGETPVLRWLQPVIRFSQIDNDFTAPREYPNPAVDWDWRKYDLGLRVGVVPGVDLTVEYSRNDVDIDLAPGESHPDEFLFTVRAGF